MAVAMSLRYQDRAYYYEAKENTNVLVGTIVLLIEVYLKTNHLYFACCLNHLRKMRETETINASSRLFR